MRHPDVEPGPGPKEFRHAGIHAPRHYETLVKNYPGFMSALEAMARAARQSGPLDEKTIHLVQLGAATAMGSETAVAAPSWTK